MKNNKGFTLIELLVSMTTFAMLIGIITLNLSTAQQTASSETIVDTLLADLSNQQLKAMVGDTEGRAESDTYGIHFATTNYTLFHGTFSQSEASNFSVAIPSSFQLTTTFPSNEVIFQKRSGEITNFTSSTDEIVVEDLTTGQRKTIEMNRYGVVTGVN